MWQPNRRRSMTCSDLAEIASSAHGPELFPKSGLLKKEKCADISNLPIALATCPTVRTTRPLRTANHTTHPRRFCFRRVSACIFVPGEKAFCQTAAEGVPGFRSRVTRGPEAVAGKKLAIAGFYQNGSPGPSDMPARRTSRSAAASLGRCEQTRDPERCDGADLERPGRPR